MAYHDIKIHCKRFCPNRPPSVKIENIVFLQCHIMFTVHTIKIAKHEKGIKRQLNIILKMKMLLIKFLVVRLDKV